MAAARFALVVAAALLALCSCDVITEIAASAHCIHAKFLYDLHGDEALGAMAALYVEAYAADPSYEPARDALRTVADKLRWSGEPLPPRVEEILNAPAVVPPSLPPARGVIAAKLPTATVPTSPPPPPTPTPTPTPTPPTPTPVVPAARVPGAPLTQADLDRAIALIQQAMNLQMSSAGDSWHASSQIIALYEEALAAVPDLAARNAEICASVHDNLGIALRAIDRVDEAIAAQRTAVRLQPGTARHRMNFAGTLFTAGRMAEAAAECRAALEIDPLHAKAMTILNSVEPITDAADPRIPMLFRQAGATERLGADERAMVHFDLFRALDKLKRREEAWPHLVKGNELALEDMRAHGPLPSEPLLEAHQQLLVRAFSKGALDKLLADADAARAAAEAAGAAAANVPDAAAVRSLEVGPIFIVGAYRSGSTLAESILCAHSAVHGAGENTAFAPVLEELQHELAQAEGAGFPHGFIAKAGRDDPLLFERLGERYVRAMRASASVAKAGKPRWVDKNLGNARNVGAILAALPNARIIHTLRSPEATCFSMYTQHFTQGSTHGRYFTCSQELLAAHYARLDALMRHWDAIVPAGRMLTVQYEDLVANQEAVSRRLLAFVGLPWEDGVLSFHTRERAVATASLAQVRKPMYNSSLEAWRRYEAELKPLRDGLAGLSRAPWRTAGGAAASNSSSSG